MTLKSAPALLAALAVAVAALATDAARADVTQAPVATGCPTAFELLSVTTLEAEGPYALPRVVDTAGNGDGYVCARVRSDGYTESDCRGGGTIACQLIALGLPVYHFIDNDNPGH
jgi:hypothetical protein